MSLEELVKNFIQKGGVLTIYPSDDSLHPIRYSIRIDGRTHTGKTNNLILVLEDVLTDDHNIDPLDDQALALIYGYDGPLY